MKKIKPVRSEKLSARITKDLMETIQLYAESNEITVSRAVEKLITRGLLK